MAFRVFVALKLATVVVDATTKGATPVGTVEVKALAVKTPVEGTKFSPVLEVRCPRSPVVLVTKVG